MKYQVTEYRKEKYLGGKLYRGNLVHDSRLIAKQLEYAVYWATFKMMVFPMGDPKIEVKGAGEEHPLNLI